MAEEPDFAAEGLLTGLEGEQRDGREALLRRLHDDGVPLDDLRRAVEEERLALLPVERAVRGVVKYSGEEIADAVGLPLDTIAAVRRAAGLPAPEPGAKAYTDTDLEQAQRLKRIVDLGVPAESLVETNRVLGRSMAQVAAAMRMMVANAFVGAGANEDEAAQRLASAAEALMPAVGPALEWAFGQHLLELLRRDVMGAHDLETGSVGAAREMNVAFGDLVGFTRLGEEIDPEDLGRVVGRFEQLAGDVIEPPVTLVKTIGDAVMLVSPKPAPLVSCALTLVEAAEGEGDEFPQLRFGIACGPVLERGGDWYGRAVNLASRVTTRARPGSVLVTEIVREHTRDEDGLSFSSAGTKKLRGVGDSVPLYRVRRAAER